jgi:NMD protein affecting ribosome stability and mRNA decay
MKQTNLTPRRPAAGRRISGHAQEDQILDPYQLREKLQEPTVCPQCGAVYHHGRWQWAARPEKGIEAHCPACRRINDKFPAGIVQFHGHFEHQRIEEIVNLARHQEQAEKGEHPLNRIISVDEDAQGIVIRTTDIHLPRRIGEAAKRAFHGTLDEHFDEGGYFVRVDWRA